MKIEKGRLIAPMRQLAELFDVPLKTLAGWKEKGVDICSPRMVARHIYSSSRRPKSWEVIERGESEEPSREAKLAAEIRKLTLEADAKQRMLEILDADFLPNEIVEEQQRKIAFVVNAFTRAAISELPPLVAGLTPAKVERVIADWVGPWVARLKDESDAVWTEAEKAIARELRGDLKKVAASQSKKPRKKKEPKQ